MSHFTCLVIGPDHEAQLQPYHEFECTGTDDQYVVEIDLTEEALKDYEGQTKTVYRNDLTGEVAEGIDDRFFRDPTDDEIRELGPFLGEGVGHGLTWSSKDWGDGNKYRSKIHEAPDGWTAEQKTMGGDQTFAEFACDWYGYELLKPNQWWTEESHKYGYVEVDDEGKVKVVKRTNPNKKWDWYAVGGRWSGFFPLKAGMLKITEGMTADQCTKGDIDFDRARDEAEKDGAREWDEWERCFSGLETPEPWSSFVARVESEDGYTIEMARVDYGNQTAIERWEHSGHNDPFTCPVITYGFDRDAYLRRCRNMALVPFAVVKDGKWDQRGSMGWFGMVSNAMDRDEWANKVQKLYDELPDDTLLTLVDCHI